MTARMNRPSRGKWIAILLLVLPALGAVGFAGAAAAGEAQPLIKDPVIEARLSRLAAEMRCLVCQGQSLAESESGFATDVKNEMYALMLQGKTDQEVVDFLVERYGDFILFRPPWKATTVLLWLGPLLFLIAGAIVLGVALARRRREPEPELSQQDVNRAELLLAGNDDNRDGST